MPTITIAWAFRQAARGWEHLPTDEVVWVDVRRFDDAWRLTDQYIGPGGLGGQDDRYGRVGRWFATRSYSDMLCVSLNAGQVAFTDGRHRFSWLRDQGVEALPLQVSPGSESSLHRLVGSQKRATVLVLRA